MASKFIELPKYDLKTIANYYKIKLTNHHSAKEDALACLEIYKQYEDKLDMEKFAESDFHDTSEVDSNGDDYNIPLMN